MSHHKITFAGPEPDQTFVRFYPFLPRVGDLVEVPWPCESAMCVEKVLFGADLSITVWLRRDYSDDT